jgi:hypothetical protein
MNRRAFLQALSILPAIGFTPLVVVANENDTVQGLERIIHIIQNDERLNKRVDPISIEIAINSARYMNEVLIEAIIQTGVANDYKITTADTREINDYIYHNYKNQWIKWHGDDEGDTETGFHKVRGNGARTKLFNKNAINKVADNIYHLGFESHLKNRLLNEDGNKNAKYKQIARWLNALLRDDLEAGTLTNPEIKEVIGDTGTGLDQAIDIIYNDRGLQKRISLGDIRTGARTANEMNRLIVEAIQSTNAATGGKFTTQDVKNINAYLVENHAERWAVIHGDDEEQGEETGFHKVQSDGAKTRLYGKNAINKVLDGIYHLGFETSYKHRLVNEDGNKNASFKKVAQWLNKLLANDLSNGNLL